MTWKSGTRSRPDEHEPMPLEAQRWVEALVHADLDPGYVASYCRWSIDGTPCDRFLRDLGLPDYGTDLDQLFWLQTPRDSPAPEVVASYKPHGAVVVLASIAPSASRPPRQCSS